MSYEIIMKIEIKKSNKFWVDEATKINPGASRVEITDEEAENIDKCEKVLLETTYSMMREELANHLERVSAEAAIKRGGYANVQKNSRLYRVDGEVGRFEFATYSVMQEGEKIYDTAVCPFVPLKGKEWYRTKGYKEIAFEHGVTQKSYRKTTQTLNRIRHQKSGGTPLGTLKESVEKEGIIIQDYMDEKVYGLLKSNGFTKEGKFKGSPSKYGKKESAKLPNDKIEKALKRCEEKIGSEYNLRENPMIYEDPAHTVNLSIDDVKVKKQKNTRERDRKNEKSSCTKSQENNFGKSKKRPGVYSTIVQVEKLGKSYVLNGYGLRNVLTIVIALLLNNGLLKYRLQFFTDGYKSLHLGILETFSWFKNISILLDWFHLEKKCKEELSRAMKGRKLRNKVLEKLTFVLWYGLVDDAVEILKNINPGWIKNPEVITALIASLQRNRPYIPCYAVRKELGLRNSSNIGEKMNDLVVSERQKHNGMSWSVSGSVALASITTVIRNKEQDLWFEKGQLEFKLHA